MSEAPKPQEAIPNKWDPRLERYGILEGFVGYMADFGISLRVVTDEHQREWMIVDIENVHLTEGELMPRQEWYSMVVSKNEGEGTVHMEIPLRYALGGFAVAFTSYRQTRDTATGEQKLTEGHESDHSGIFFFHVVAIDHPEHVSKYGFRSDYSKADLERRRAARAKGSGQ